MNVLKNSNKNINVRSEIEMDKRRRDIVRNHEWWWRDLYDEDGEVGKNN